MKSPEEILQRDSAKRIDIRSIQGYSDTSWSNLALATLLSWLGGFESSLIASRLKIGIEPTFGIRHLLKLPADGASGDLSQLGVRLYPRQLTVLNEQSDEILRSFNLPGSWFISVKFAILSNVLYLPPRQAPIEFTAGGSPGQYPAIYVTRHVTIAGLRKFLEANKDAIRKTLEKLPSGKDRQIEEQTLFWGQVVSVMRAQLPLRGGEPFRQIKEHLEEVFQPTTRDETDPTVPDVIELRKYYERFLIYGNQLQPGLLIRVDLPGSEEKPQR